MSHGSKILGGSEKRPKAKAKTDRSIKKERCVGQVFEPLRVGLYPQCDTTLKMTIA